MLAALYTTLLPLPSRADELEATLNLNPRLEILQSREKDLARRTFLRTQGYLKKDGFTFNAEAFFEHDFARQDLEPSGPPDLRRSRDCAILQEAYGEYQKGAVSLRVGRQPVRWSQSWSIPSLDLFTARRYNRLFYDPVPEQLVHPDGALLSYAGSTIEADLFQVIRPAVDVFPEPLPVKDREFKSQTGFRVKVRLKGLDVALMGRTGSDETLLGGAANYAFDTFVLKAEAGQSRDTQGFMILGSDVFVGNFTLTPQFTWYSDPALTQDKVETIAYLPLRYVSGKHSIDLQYYRQLEHQDEFASALYAYDLSDLIKVSGFVQYYDGEQGRLFGLFKSLTGPGPVYGLRFEMNAAL